MTDVTDAQNGDHDAIAAVLRSDEGCVVTLADRAAHRMGRSGFRDEFVQVGHIAVWSAIGRYDSGKGTTFCSYAWRAVEVALADAVQNELFGGTGADSSALKVFAQMLKIAGGNPYLAEQIAPVIPPKGRRLSKHRANAARLAYQGAAELADTLTARSADAESGDQRLKRAFVRATLASMGAQQRAVLAATYGIDGAAYGSANDGELADRLGTTRRQVQSARKRGHARFAELWAHTR